MSTSSNPTPDDHHEPDRLSSWEQQVLAGIEQGLEASDPRLARTLARAGPRTARRWWPLSATCSGLLVAGLIVLVVAGALLPDSAWAALAAITAVVVVPWLLLCATERRGSG